MGAYRAVGNVCSVRLSRFRAGGMMRLGRSWEKDGMNEALLIPLAVGTGVVVIVVAIAVVLVVLFATVSMRGRQRRGAKRRDETRHDRAAAHERAERAERDRDTAREQAAQRIDPDR
jgi:uncharacterized membrane protein